MDTRKWSLAIISLSILSIASSSAELLIQQVTEGRGIEYKSSYNLDVNLGVTRALRDQRPSSKIVTITSFSVLKDSGLPYESSVFEAVGYKWSLLLYVKGNKKDGGSGHISLYVRIEETNSLPKDWEVNVDLKLFVHNPKQQKYLTVTDGEVKRYNNAKKEWGFGQMIPLSTFYNTNEGYIVDDTVTFGAEIFMVNSTKVQEKVTFISNPPDNIFTWKLPNYSTLKDPVYQSNMFAIGDRYWGLGLDARDKITRPLFMFGLMFKENAVATTTWADVTMRLKNQRNSNDRERRSAAWYPIQMGYAVGVADILEASDLNDASEFYVNDTIIFETEMVMVSVTNIAST